MAHTRTHTRTYTHTNTNAHEYTQARTRRYTLHMRTYEHKYTRAIYTRTNTQALTRAHKHTCTRTHTCTHAYARTRCVRDGLCHFFSVASDAPSLVIILVHGTYSGQSAVRMPVQVMHLETFSKHSLHFCFVRSLHDNYLFIIYYYLYNTRKVFGSIRASFKLTF